VPAAERIRHPAALGPPTVILVHDYLTQRGGAERVALEMARQFPGAPLLTTFYEPSTTFAGFQDVDVRPCLLSRLSPLRRDPRRAFPLLAGMITVRRAPAGIVLASSSGWAHGLRTRGPKIVYCHNPARWLYQPDDYFAALPRAARRAIARLLAPLRTWDRRAARSATRYLANSTVVAARIEKSYGITATVVHPPAGLLPDGPREPIPGIEPGYFLTIGRRRGYKNNELVCAAATAAGRRLVIVGGASADGGPGIVGVSDISDAQLRWLYANCAAVVAMSKEDFGLTPVEGFGFGKPCIALRAGGYLDSCVEGLTGTFVDEPDLHQLTRALRRFDPRRYSSSAITRHAQRFSPAEFGRLLRDEVARAAHPAPIASRIRDSGTARAV
jgi:glycosyltransferase involved in cell wall biosynthesis